MFAEHLPVLQIAIPLVAAPICALIAHRILSWVFATLTAWASLGMALSLLARARGGEVIHYELGGWAPPAGIEYVVDVTNAFVLVIVTAVASLVMPYAPMSLSREVDDSRHHYIYAAILLCMTGLLGIAITGDAFNVFVFLEISSLSAYVLIALGPTRRALTAAYQYLVMGTIGGTFILIGIGLMYMMTGTLNMADLAARIPDVSHLSTTRAALAFLVVGVSIKLAVFPLHQWLPNAYTYAPNVVTAFLSATATKVSYYVLLRVIFVFFGVSLVFGEMHLDRVFLVISLLAIYGASLVAIFQRDVKRLLAYSSVAQIGYMTLGLSIGNVSGLAGGIVHLFNHALMKGGLFLVLGCVFYRVGSTKLDDMAGIAKGMPLTMAAFAVGGLSLIGVPMTVGFVSKWYLIAGALEAGLWWVAGAALLSSLLAVIYIWRVVEAAWFQPRPEGAPQVREAPAALLVPTWIMIAATVVFGLFAEDTAAVALQAAAQLMGVAL